MKQILLLTACVLTITTMSCSQQLKEKDLPAPVKESFSTAYSNPGKVKWNKENENEYEASFVSNGKETAVVYSSDGVLLETETEIAATELPAVVTDYIKTHFKNAKINEAAKIIKKNGSVVYEAEVNKKDLLFDVSGKLLETEG